MQYSFGGLKKNSFLWLVGSWSSHMWMHTHCFMSGRPALLMYWLPCRRNLGMWSEKSYSLLWNGAGSERLKEQHSDVLSGKRNPKLTRAVFLRSTLALKETNKIPCNCLCGCYCCTVWLDMEVLCATFLLKLVSAKRKVDLKPTLNRSNGGNICIEVCVCT